MATEATREIPQVRDFYTEMQRVNLEGRQELARRFPNDAFTREEKLIQRLRNWSGK